MAGFDSTKDYYSVLGVSEKASPEEIDRAFRSEARKRHPDGGGSEEEMKSLNEAHDILSDPEIRKAYDAERNPPQTAHYPSTAFNADAAAAAGTLKIPVSDEDFAGLAMGAATCLLVGLPLWLLVEIQWVFFLWPLRLMALGALGLGAVMAHSALTAKSRNLKKSSRLKPGALVIYRITYWVVVIMMLVLIVAFYVTRRH